MRVSSLSDSRIVDLVSKYFVPVCVSRDDYQRDPRSDEEKAEMLRLDRDRAKRGFKGGNVCVFVIAANGDVLATQPVQLAYKPENLVPFLQTIIAEKKLGPRSEEAIRTSAAKPEDDKSKPGDSRYIHVWTCMDTGQNRGVSNDRVALTAAQCQAFLPPPDAKPGTSWTIPEDIAQKLFQYGYPPGPQWRTTDCKVMKGTLKATLLAVSEAETRFELEGEMLLKFPLGRATEGRITSRFVGAARADLQKHTLTSLGLVSESAEYVWYWQSKPQLRKMRVAMELEP